MPTSNKKTTASPAVFPSSLFGIELLPSAAYLGGVKLVDKWNPGSKVHYPSVDG